MIVKDTPRFADVRLGGGLITRSPRKPLNHRTLSENLFDQADSFTGGNDGVCADIKDLPGTTIPPI